MGAKINCGLQHNLENQAKTFSFMDFFKGKQAFAIASFSMLTN